MAGFYKGNALYDYISANGFTNYKYLCGNLWLLVYGDSGCEAKLIVVLSAVQDDIFDNVTYSGEEKEAIKIASLLSSRSEVPWIYVRFLSSESTLTKAVYSCPSLNKEFEECSVSELRTIYTGFGLPITATPSKKEINKQFSNAYQKWQLYQGCGLTASDIDLLRTDEENITDAFELKRSKIALAVWQPYPADYNNFRLLSDLFIRAKIEFYIVYNHRQEYPFVDDISTLKVFLVNKDSKQLCQFERYVSLEEFFETFKNKGK